MELNQLLPEQRGAKGSDQAPSVSTHRPFRPDNSSRLAFCAADLFQEPRPLNRLFVVPMCGRFWSGLVPIAFGVAE